jgi:hypothetical protein
MSEETDQPTPAEQPAAPKAPAKNTVLKKPPFNPFAKNNNHFTSPKSGNPGNKGKAFKGGSMKKGK